MRKSTKTLVFVSISTILILFTLSFFFEITGYLTGFAAQAFSMTMCVNTQPTISNTTCPTDIFENTLINCYFNATDPDLNETLNFSSVFDGANTVFTVNQTGGVYEFVDFLDIGNHTYNVTVVDNSGCPNFAYTQSRYINIISSGNHPPYLVQNIPDKTWPQDTVIVPYDLNNYFDDIDGDPMTFRSTYSANINIQIDSFGIVTLTPSTGFYGVEYVYFYADDPLNATGTSNQVKLEVTRVQEPEPSQDSDTTSRAPTGGLSEVSCFPDWECGNWSECFPQGFRYRECTDSNNCSSTFLRPEVSELCDYTPTCDDEIQNGNETGIDCGGKCPQMCELKPTCSDAIQNQNEQGVDCGGECPPCQLHESCYDGLKNQDEEGVDCGGTCERKCPAAELPTILQKINWKILIWTLLLLIVTGVGSYYVYEHRYQFLKEIKKIRKLIKRKLLLAAADKGKILLDRLDKLEQELANILPQKALGELSEIIDTYLMLLLETEEALTHKEIVLKLKESELETPLKEILKSYYIDMTRLEFSKEKPSSTFVQALIYEAKSLVNTTLKTKKKTPIRFEILSQIIPKTQSDLNYQKIVGLNLGFLNNNVAEIKEGYTKVCSDIASKNIKSKYAINSVKRFHKLYNFKNAQKK